ncbi:hypothetical protein IT084_07120 [Desulfallas sp. Bu1-1]|uniref:hypothetical protein n=1 Tax=Desulfallas sp. Bu1-1 TaxID=2787620 RepID=UPI0018A0E859|nr:hypothetical protein [Desulfallas sp. Bu1-1]MBF7082749.1 hypothetical protein [Desulfallas sp. Bu1-1]
MVFLSTNKWEAYVGLHQEVVAKELCKALKELRISFKKSKKPPIFMYDANHEQLVFQLDDLELSLVYVTADPLTRFFSSFLGTRKNFPGLTYLSVSFCSLEARTKLKQIMKAFYNNVKQEPWQISWHPRFRHAFLLQLFNKWQWQRMLR